MGTTSGPPEAVAVLFDLAHEIGRGRTELAPQLRALGGVLGLLERDSQAYLQGGHEIFGAGGIRSAEEFGNPAISFSGAANTEFVPAGFTKSIQKLIEDREAAGKAKNFSEADKIRDELLSAGIVLEDGPTGTTWRRA